MSRRLTMSKILRCSGNCGITIHLFNGSQEICFTCLTPYKHSEEEIKKEMEVRGHENT